MFLRTQIGIEAAETSGEAVTTPSSAAFSCDCPPLFRDRNFRASRRRSGGAAAHLLSGRQWQEIHQKRSLGVDGGAVSARPPTGLRGGLEKLFSRCFFFCCFKQTIHRDNNEVVHYSGSNRGQLAGV